MRSDMRKKIAAIVICSLLVLGGAFALSACKGNANKAPSTVADFTSSNQTSGNVTMVNYQVIVNADADWNSMSTSDRQKIIDYAFAQARQDIAANDVSYYNIMGKSQATADQDSQMLFMFDKDNNQVLIYVDGQVADQVAPPAE